MSADQSAAGMVVWLALKWADMMVEMMVETMTGLRAVMKAEYWVDTKAVQRVVMPADQ